MKREWLDVITERLGVAPVFIQSSLVSAQSRQRYYWCNWDVPQPEDRGVVLADIIEDGVVDRDKSHCIDASYHKGGDLNQYFNKSRRQVVFEGSPAWGSPYRKLSVVECCRLQGVPDDYFKVSSKTQAYKMLGNGWQVDTIMHIFNHAPGLTSERVTGRWYTLDSLAIDMPPITGASVGELAARHRLGVVEGCKDWTLLGDESRRMLVSHRRAVGDKTGRPVGCG